MSIRLAPGTFGTFPKNLAKGLPPIEQTVLVWLWCFTNEDNECWPSLRTLANACGIRKEETVRNAIACLKERGFLAVEDRYRADGSQSTNSYILFIHGASPLPANGTPPPPGKREGGPLPANGRPKLKPTTLKKPIEEKQENLGSLDLVPAPPVINKHQKIMNLYNAAAEEAGLPRCTVLNASRKRQIDARLAEYPSPKQWAPVFQTVRNFKRRVDDGDRMRWFSFDWFIKSTVNFDKVASDWLSGVPTDKQRAALEQKKGRPANTYYEDADSPMHKAIAARTIKGHVC
jgi:hypothetical protein